MTFLRYATDENNTVVQGLYNSDGDYVGPENHRHHLTNITHTPVMAELVALASKHTGLKAEYRLGGQTYEEMDWADAAESYDAGYRPDPNTGAIFTSMPLDTDMSLFWQELDRLQAIIKRPLNETVMADHEPVHQGYVYVFDGEVRQFIDGANMTVAHVKQLPKDRGGADEVRRCDLTGRQLRLPVTKKPEAQVQSTMLFDGKRQGQKKRRSRCSNKIKKVLH